MPGEEPPAAPAARQIARLIMVVALIGAGGSALLSFSGHIQTGLWVCGGSAGVGLVVFLVGGWVVAAGKPEDD
jgi:hypothetical protein